MVSVSLIMAATSSTGYRRQRCTHRRRPAAGVHVRPVPALLLFSVLLLTQTAQAAAGQTPTARSLQQAAVSVNNRELPRLNIGRVTASQTNTYSWSIQRQSSASGIAVTADGYNRKQLGYSLTYTRTLQKQQFKLEGVAAITNPSGQGTASLLSLNIVVGGREVQPVCQGMPAVGYTLQPAAVIECSFAVTWDSLPAGDVISGYVETSFGRAAATTAPIAYSFDNCGGSSTGSSSNTGGAAPAVCVLQEVAACVSVTDGSYIINKYKDKVGQSLSGTISRSRLFDTSAIQDSTLGPPRTEPVVPQAPAAPAASVAAVPDSPPEWTPRLPDASWWNRRLLMRLPAAATINSHQRQQALENTPNNKVQHIAPERSSSSGRRLQQQQTTKADLIASIDAGFQWPYPTITGDRPPVGLNGKPNRGQAREICGSHSFQYGMVFGPLLPAACGTFEVQNNAAALPSDASSPAVTSSTYSYLQVLCPTATFEKASAAADADVPAASGQGGS